MCVCNSKNVEKNQNLDMANLIVSKKERNQSNRKKPMGQRIKADYAQKPDDVENDNNKDSVKNEAGKIDEKKEMASSSDVVKAAANIDVIEGITPHDPEDDQIIEREWEREFKLWLMQKGPKPGPHPDANHGWNIDTVKYTQEKTDPVEMWF